MILRMPCCILPSPTCALVGRRRTVTDTCYRGNLVGPPFAATSDEEREPSIKLTCTARWSRSRCRRSANQYASVCSTVSTPHPSGSPSWTRRIIRPCAASSAGILTLWHTPFRLVRRSSAPGAAVSVSILRAPGTAVSTSCV